MILSDEFKVRYPELTKWAVRSDQMIRTTNCMYLTPSNECAFHARTRAWYNPARWVKGRLRPCVFAIEALDGAEPACDYRRPLRVLDTRSNIPRLDRKKFHEWLSKPVRGL